MTITINGKDYQFNMSGWWGPQYKFEEIMDVAEYPERRFNPQLTFHLHVMLYCILLCDNDPLDLSLDEFMKALEDLSLTKQMTDYYTSRVQIITQTLTPKKADKETSKKKSSQRTRSMRG